MNRIRECRKKKKLTLKQLSEELAKNNFKISADALGKYERGDREPKLETLLHGFSINHCKISISWLDFCRSIKEDSFELPQLPLTKLWLW